MTLVMVWREARVDRVWIVSDSRLSNASQSGQVRLTDRAAKILEANLALYGSNVSDGPVSARTIGFAYTGSSLVALQAYSAILPLWSRLRSSGTQVLPTIGECASHLSRFVTAYAHEVAAGGAGGDCQCVLLGFDEGARSIEAWLVSAYKSSGGIEGDVRALQLAPGMMEIFGSGKADAEVQLADFRPSGSGWNREPLQMIRHHLRGEGVDAVGGGVQLGMATNAGFELCFDVQPFAAGASAAGDPTVAMTYRGFPFHEIGTVGSAFVFLRGIGW